MNNDLKHKHLEAGTAKCLGLAETFRKEGTKGAKIYHQYSKEGKGLRFRKEDPVNFLKCYNL